VLAKTFIDIPGGGDTPEPVLHGGPRWCGLLVKCMTQTNRKKENKGYQGVPKE